MDYLKFGACVDLVKSRTNILEIFSKYTKLRENGKVYVGKCPFHKDEGESLTVNPIEGKYYCFGCHAGGDVFNFLARAENVSLSEALELQAKSVGLDISFTNVNLEDERVNLRNRALIEVNDYAKDFYHEILTKTDEGAACRKYLESRGISKREIEKFQMGFAPNVNGKLSAYLDEYGFKFEVILQTGLVEANSEGFDDKFQDCITIPIINNFGQTIALIGQIFNFNKKVYYETEGISKQYIFPRESPIFNSYQLIFGLNEARNFIVKSESVIVAANCLDAIYLKRTGIENVVATFDGTLTKWQAEILAQFAKKIIFCLKDGGTLPIEESTITAVASKEVKLLVAALPKEIYEYVGENGKDIFLQSLKDAVSFKEYTFAKTTYDAIEKKKLEDKNSYENLIKHKPIVPKLGVAILKVVCRDPALFKHFINVVPNEIFDARHQRAIEYLKVCLDENSRPLKKGAEIFFEGNPDKEFQDILENALPLSDEERLACEDALDYLLKRLWAKDYLTTKADALIEQEKIEKLSQMNNDKEY